MRAKEIDDASDDAWDMLEIFIRRHRAAAIPVMIGACVRWAVENGGTDVVKGSLSNAIKLADQMHAAHRKVQP